MAVTFPDSPVLNQSYQAENGLTYIWDGEKWSSQGAYNITEDNYIRKDGTNTTVFADATSVGIGTTTPSSELEVVGDIKTTTLNGLSYPDAGALSNRNIIINGAMTVAQRGTSGVQSAGLHLTVDRFRTTCYTDVTLNVTVETDAPAGFANSYKSQFPTAANFDTNDSSVISYSIEAQDIAHLNYGSATASDVVLSFWVKSNKTGDASLEALQVAADRLYTTTYTINAADTWEYKTIVIPGDVSGAILNDNTKGMDIYWWLNSGPQWTGGVSQTWAAKVDANRNHTNLGVGDANGDYYSITGVQLEIGTIATPFEHRRYADELRLCQRYFQTIVAGRVNAPTVAFGESSQVVCSLPLAVTPRVNLAHDISGAGELTRVGTIAVNAFPSSAGNNVTGINFFSNIGNLLSFGLLTSASYTADESVPVRYGAGADEVVFTLDTEL